MTTLIALDPGTRISGLALFENNVLIHARAVKVDVKRPVHARIQLMVRALFDLCGTGFVDYTAEWPVVYPQRQREDPNDLLPLCGVVHGLRAMLGQRVVSERYPSPAMWKGQRPKKIIMAHVKAKLSDVEWVKIADPKDSNCVEAAGIGLNAVGRL